MSNIRTFLTFVCLFSLSSSILAQEISPKPNRVLEKSGFALKSLRLSTIQDDTLHNFLDALERNNHILVKDGSAISLPYATPMLVIPLSKLEDPNKILHMYYLSEKKLYFFLQIGYNNENKEEARLWTRGSPEILLSEDMMGFLPTPSESTFRISEEVEQTIGIASTVGTADLDASEILSCIARVIGVGFDPTSLRNAIASASCSTLNIVNLVVLACNCLSIPSVGPALVFATIGCVSGIGAYIACGVLNCGSSGCSSSTIAFNSSVGGSWSSSCTSTHRSGRYAQYYTFSLSSQTQVQIDLQSSVDTYLYLLSGNGTGGSVITSDDDSGDGTNSRIVRTLSAGTYTIEATTFNSSATGSFTISARTGASGGGCITSIAFNASVGGSWSSSCTSTHRSGRYAQYYTFSLSSQTQVQIDLQSSVDTYLYLLSGNGTGGSVITSDDDSGDGTDSRIVRTLSPGTYTIEATTFNSSATGSFTISARR